MDVVTEQALRAAGVRPGTAVYELPEGALLTPGAREYLRDCGVALRAPHRYRPMPRQPMPRECRFVDEQGEVHTEKPEELTHLGGDRLVSKTHPRIVLRGKLDSLMAEILLVQCRARAAGQESLRLDLEELLQAARGVMSAEVMETPCRPLRLFGLDDARLRWESHHVQEAFGMDHPLPDDAMGETALLLNHLRTAVREAELAAAAAFQEADGSVGRLDLVQTLNRMSSGVYILFCRVLSGYYKPDKGAPPGGGAALAAPRTPWKTDLI